MSSGRTTLCDSSGSGLSLSLSKTKGDLVLSSIPGAALRSGPEKGLRHPVLEQAKSEHPIKGTSLPFTT